MNIAIPYNGKIITVTVEDDRVAGVIGRNPTAVKDEREVLLNAMSHPLESDSLASFLVGGKKILFIVNDSDRNTPTAKVLDVLMPSIPIDRSRFIVATGTHPAPGPQELALLFGRHFLTVRDRILIHDSRDDSQMVSFGITRRGTEVRLNRAFAEADRTVAIGSVEPHYFAGYTGGRKAFLPGIAAYKSIEQNHRLVLETGVRVLALEGNPVHEDAEEALGFIESKPVFSIQLVLDLDERIGFAAAGNLQRTFLSAVQKAREIYCVPIREKADIVVAVASPPLDRDLYQAHKGIENVKSVLKDGGILILIAGCSRGLGNDSFIRLLKNTDSPMDVFKRIKKGYVLGYHKAAKIAELLSRTQIWAVTGLEPDVLKSIFIRPFESVQTAVDLALSERRNAKVLFVNSATTVVPVL